MFRTEGNLIMKLEARIQHITGPKLLSYIPRRRLVSVCGVQDILMRQTMASPELAKAMFGLVADSGDITSISDLRFARAAHFEGVKIDPFLMRMGIGLPAALFYPFFRLSCASMASRFIAGNTIAEALDNVAELVSKGIGESLDILGESVGSIEDAQGNLGQYERVIQRADQRFDWFIKHRGHKPNFSVKLTGLYPEAGLIEENRREIELFLHRALALAFRYHAFMRLDTEYYEKLKLTNSVYRTVASQEPFITYPGHGIVQQLYLTEAELIAKEWIAFAKWRFDKYQVPSSFRLVKGAYVETERKRALAGGYASPICATKPLTNANYEYIAEMHLRAIAEHGPIMRLAFGTHNPRTVAAIMAMAEELKIDKSLLEFQVLFGMDDLIPAIQAMGYAVREYMPLSPDGDKKRGLPYYSRRLVENTANGSMMMMVGDWQRGLVSTEQLLQNPLELV